MENDAVSHVMTAESSSAATCTAASGRFFPIPENRLPGTPALPASPMRAATEHRTHSSRATA